ncbi:MAG TPA: molybdenum cofactor biosynthesis protein MoaE [Ilumatobacteraceae bacterium]|nr:molybdenum cofactor biosynthesis protein MoaE [Ilumatobacteraceae bacterium]
MFNPPDSDTWVAVGTDPLPVAAAYEWAVRPHCGAVVLFSGTVRDHAEGRSGVQHLTYEAYDEQVVAALGAVADEARTRWPSVGAIALLHRLGRIELEESSVVVVVSAPHRGEAFEAGRYAIDATKVSAPIWKHEVWDDGAGWGTGAADLCDPADVGSAVGSPSTGSPSVTSPSIGVGAHR